MAEQQRPRPPDGFAPFRWKKRRGTYHTQCLCPYCGEPGNISYGGEPGLAFQPGGPWWGWADPAPLETYLAAASSNNYDRLCIPVDGVMVKMHWSRWGTTICTKCGGVVWHDWGSPMRYYWMPPPPSGVVATAKGLEPAEYQQGVLM